MSPAGHWPQLYAAIEAGADAVYFGLKHFTARAKVGFSLEELPRAIETLHRRGVKGFVTFNTLVFDSELQQAESALRAVARAGADAVIIQDLGMAYRVHRILPELVLHGSTQMSITNASGAELARSAGCSRVVLGRELSLSDIAHIAEQTDIELEVFAHGALCVSYSGQCFSSEAWGGRSANRGQCAQACRLSYDLFVDGQRRDLGPYRYLLSPGDLCALDQIPQLMALGVACVKIEGRYKDADYVALVTNAYRRAIDSAANGQPLTNTADTWRELEQVYSRGLGPHFLSGTNHQQVVVGRAPRHRGLRVGRVVRVERNRIEVETEQPIFRGDGLVFDAADRRSPELPEQGGFVYDVRSVGLDRVELEFATDKVDASDVAVGDWVWRTHDPRLSKKAKQWTQATTPVYRRPLDFIVEGHVGAFLKISASTDDGLRAVWTDAQPLANARSPQTPGTTVREQLERLGGTSFRLDKLVCDLDEHVFIPASTVNRARRELVADLLNQRISVPAVVDATPVIEPSVSMTIAADSRAIDPRIHLLVRTPDQLASALALRPDSITLDYLDLFGLRTSLQAIRDAGIAVRVASPRIVKPAERNVQNFLLSLDCALLIRSGGLLWDLTRPVRRSQLALIADFSLNAANHITAQALIDLGADVVTPTHDLNAQQIVELAGLFDPRRLEVVAYQHLPIFHTEHCVFCRFLSNGTDRTNCGQPCERHQVTLRDTAGRVHPILADVGCRNTVFNAPIQSAARHLAMWRRAGIRDFRLEFVHQRGADIVAAVDAIRRYFGHQLDALELEARWRSTAPAGTTEGSLHIPETPRDLIQLT